MQTLINYGVLKVIITTHPAMTLIRFVYRQWQSDLQARRYIFIGCHVLTRPISCDNQMTNWVFLANQNLYDESWISISDYIWNIYRRLALNFLVNKISKHHQKEGCKKLVVYMSKSTRHRLSNFQSRFLYRC